MWSIKLQVLYIRIELYELLLVSYSHMLCGPTHVTVIHKKVSELWNVSIHVRRSTYKNTAMRWVTRLRTTKKKRNAISLIWTIYSPVIGFISNDGMKIHLWIFRILIGKINVRRNSHCLFVCRSFSAFNNNNFIHTFNSLWTNTNIDWKHFH